MVNLTELAKQVNNELALARGGFRADATPEQKAAWQTYYMAPMMGVTSAPGISNASAQVAARVGQKYDALAGKLNIQDVDELMNAARQELLKGKYKIPLKKFSSMPLKDLIAELRSLISPEQAQYIGG